MSKIKIKFNTINENFEIHQNDINSYYVDIFFEIINIGEFFDFQTLNFGYNLTKSGQLVNQNSWPPNGVIYFKTDQETLATERINWEPDSELLFDFWMQTSGKRYEFSFPFIVPKPDQTFPSWIWNNNIWESPVQYPEDGNLYNWNEDSKNWNKVEIEE
jgi:hypothetical protein